MKDRFRIKLGVNDPRGKHHIVVDDSCGLVPCSAWEEDDIIKLKEMLDTGGIKPDYESRYIGADVERYLNN